MNIEQKKMLYEIANLHLRSFYLNMADHWEVSDFLNYSKISNSLIDLEKRYKKLYGELPIWGNIEELQRIKNELEKEVKTDNE